MSDVKTILVVDDDDDVTLGMKARFNGAGYRTIVADSVESGMQAARTERPEAIVMDVRMKGGCGLDAVEQLKRNEETANIPIVMLSGCIGSQQQALDNGARFFLRKPYRGCEVLTAVEAAIRESHSTEIEPSR